MAVTFRVVHISDIHIASPGAREIGCNHEISAVEAMARFVHTLEPKPDCIVLSGDLVHFPRRKWLERARSLIQSPRKKNGSPWLSADNTPTLRDAASRVVVLPGNHDRYGLFTAGDAFDDYLNPPWDCGVGGVQQVDLPLGGPAKMVLVCADYCLTSVGQASTAGGIWGQGIVDGDPVDPLTRLGQVCAITKAAPSDATVVWVVHFAPEFESLPGIMPHPERPDPGCDVQGVPLVPQRTGLSSSGC